MQKNYEVEALFFNVLSKHIKLFLDINKGIKKSPEKHVLQLF